MKKSHDSKTVLEQFEPKCPAGGENAVVVYTTTLRGIRKTFEECNTVRSIIESYHIQMSERDISMDSGFKEELRKLTGTKEVKVPLVFVKGRLVGGVEEIVKLEEEGKLEILLEGIPVAVPGCKGCGGVRFVMCKQCNGSCKVLDKEQKKIRKLSISSKEVAGIHSSGTTELEKQVLNSICYCERSSSSGGLRSMSPAEEKMNEREDKLYIIDMWKAWMRSTKENATNLDRAIRDGVIQNPKAEHVDTHFPAYNIKFIAKLYGKDGRSMVDRLRDDPRAFLPILIKRLDMMELKPFHIGL
ncbi:hypothetical protein V6N11_066157 [Hibiscus sabdariffa]|uniref:Glutaredoxin domain-containing protein n=1 Tax=Hibiscus sabdariffa TaxID=183260 RepID=A0ABR2AGS8_9ROSI